MKKKRKWPKVLGIIVGVILVLYFGGGLANYICNVNLRNYIKTFAPIDYEGEQIVPEKDENGYYTFTTDRELKIMHIADIHIGGGIFSYKRDKKSIYEVMTMVAAEKPDLVILGGDNTYALFKIGFNGGGTFNNKMVARTVISMFEQEGVYFSTVFGNHDTESVDYANRQEVGELYESDEFRYCIFEEEFTDPEADTVPSVSNQCILVKNTDGKITKVVMLLDTNAYVNTSFIAAILGKYDTIHQAQIDWAKDVITDLSRKEGLPEGEYLKSLVFVHIPIGEYMTAYNELFTDVYDANGKLTGFVQNDDPENTEFVWGHWDETKVYYGGVSNTDILPEDQDLLFETLAEEMGSMEAIICGHDHVNNNVVYYKGVMLSYDYTVDNIAYQNAISVVGNQRGAEVITVSTDGSFTVDHKNAYTDYGCDPDKYLHVDVDGVRYPELYRTIEQ